MISTIVALPYELARLPLVVADHTLQDRLPESSVPRLVLDRALSSADQVAGAVLRQPAISQRGSDRLERSRKRLAAEQLEEQADVRRAQAREAAESGRREADDLRESAEDRLVEGLAEADEVEARGKRAAATSATTTASVRQATADRRAAARAAAAERRRQAAAQGAATKKKAAQRGAAAKVDEARDAKSAATRARADASRLEDLTETSRERRRR